MIKNNNKGFSLIELMVVVGIIGILAAVAVPNLLKFQAKAKQSNAKTELSALYGLEKAFAVEYSTYATNLKALGFAPDGVPTNSGCANVAPAGLDATTGTSTNWPIRYYSTGFGTATALPANFPNPNCAVIHIRNTVGDKDFGATGTTTAATSFTISAIGKISTDTGVPNDTWTVTEAKIFQNTVIGY